MNDEYRFLTDRGHLAGRRRFMKKTGSLVALGSLPGYLAVNADALNAALGELKRQQGVVLYRNNNLHSSTFADTLAKAGFQAVALTDDPVRQWRDSLGKILDNPAVPVAGLTNWADYLMISGLAAEQRRHVMLEMEHSLIQPGREDWSARLAIDFLHLPEKADHHTMQSLVSEYLDRHPLNAGTQSLFSWLIA